MGKSRVAKPEASLLSSNPMPRPPCPAVLSSALPHPPRSTLPCATPFRLANLQRASSAEMTPAPSPNSVELASWIASASLAKVRAASTGPKIWEAAGAMWM